MGKIITREHDTGAPFDDTNFNDEAADAMTEDEILEAAKSDPDAQPLTAEQIKHLKIRRPNLDNRRTKNG